MKIWKAELVMLITEDGIYKIKFRFTLQKEDYKVNENNNEWIYHRDWICNRVPMKMMFENSTYSTIKVVQGFDHELYGHELRQLEKDMKNFMKKILEHDKEVFLKQHEMKMDALNW